MSKVICDVCGTTFPETATKCPVCGSAKQSVNQTAAGQNGSAPGEGDGYTYVKGGRFSKRNVRRRNKGNTAAQKRVAAADRQTSRRKTKDDDKANPTLVAIVVILLLAIVAVVVYIAVRMLFPGVPEQTNPSESLMPSTSATTPSDQPTDAKIPCTGLTLSSKTVTLSKAGDVWMLDAHAAPAETTDAVSFKSLNESIATVDASGKITAVAAGETVIQVTCGTVTEECRVVCSFGGTDNPTDPPATTNPPDPEFVFEFNTRYVEPTSGLADATIEKGKTWKVYKGTLSVSVDDIIWLSDDPTVCVVEKGVATAVGSGYTKIHAVYNGTTYTCWFRVPNS